MLAMCMRLGLMWVIIWGVRVCCFGYGGLLIRTIVFWGLYRGPPMLGSSHLGTLLKSPRLISFTEVTWGI